MTIEIVDFPIENGDWPEGLIPFRNIFTAEMIPWHPGAGATGPTARRRVQGPTATKPYLALRRPRDPMAMVRGWEL